MSAKTRRGSVLRRGSMVNVAVPKLARRLELQNCFDGMKDADKDTVNRRLLATIIRSNMDITSYFSGEQYEALAGRDEDEEISWIEFLEFIQACENGTVPSASQRSHKKNSGGLEALEEDGDEGGSAEVSAAEDDAPVDDNAEILDLVERQSRALEIEILGNKAVIGSLDTNDIRLQVGRSNKLVVYSDSDPADIVASYASKERIPEFAIPTLFDNIEKAIIKSCHVEVGLLNTCVSDCLEQLDTMAELILTSEDKMLQAVEEFTRFQFQQKHMSADRRSSIQREIEISQGKTVAETTATPAQLASKLSAIQTQVAATQAEVRMNMSYVPSISNDPDYSVHICSWRGSN